MSDNTKFSLINLPDIPDSVDNAAKNLTDVPTKNMGQTFGDLWYLVFGGITQAADKRRMKYAHDLEIYNQELNAAIEQIPEDNKVEPSIQVTAQALENSKYCVSEPELRKMFVNLISNSMNRTTSDKVHPSFPEIIKQMAPLDAIILSSFKKKTGQPIAQIVLSLPDRQTVILDNYLYFDINGGHRHCYADSISSLERLGLLAVDFSRYISIDSLYDIFTNWSYFKQIKEERENIEANEIVNLKKGICRLTPLGHTFVDACIS